MKVLPILVLALIVASCSRKTDVQLYTEGTGAHEQGNFALAAERYEEIVDRFPGTAYAESSLSHAAVMYNNDLRDMKKAAAAYQKFYHMFPASKQAPTMMFLAAFLYNNELHQIDSARHIYEQFLATYPAHDLAASAKFELANLGKDPNLTLDNQVAVGDSTPAPPKKKARR